MSLDAKTEEQMKQMAVLKVIAFVQQFNRNIELLMPIWKLRCRAMVKYCSQYPLQKRYFAVIDKNETKKSKTY